MNTLASTSPVQIVSAFWSAVERTDLKTAATFLAEDITWEVMGIGHMLPKGSVCRGKAQVIDELLPFVYSVYQPNSLRFTIRSQYVDGNTVVMEFLVNAVTSRGRPYVDVPYISIFKLEEGKVKSIREYVDALKAMAGHFD